MMPMADTLAPLTLDAAKAPSVLVLDTFTGANGVDIASRMPDVHQGSGWQYKAGSQYQISSNVAVCTGLGVDSFGTAYIDAGVSDCVFSCIANAYLFQRRLLFRCVDGTDALVAILAPTLLVIGKIGPGGATYASTPHTFLDNVNYLTTITLAGTSITVDVDGISLSCVTSANMTATKYGFSANQVFSTTRYDNFQIVG